MQDADQAGSGDQSWTPTPAAAPADDNGGTPAAAPAGDDWSSDDDAKATPDPAPAMPDGPMPGGDDQAA